MIARIALCFLMFSTFKVYADVDLITEPRPGEEYVLVSSGQQTPVRHFETSHKIPEKHPQHHVYRPEETHEKIIKKLHSGKAKHPSEGIIAIEEDKRVLLKKAQKGKFQESIEIDVPTSKLEDIKIKENIKDIDTNPKMDVALENMSVSGKLSDKLSTNTQKPILTTAAPVATTKAYDYVPINFDTIDDINTGLLTSNLKLETAGSEQKQHSRIQIKKGPNGQDYEYEYIYYYYDEEDDPKKDSKDKQLSTTTSPIHNSHDGPQKLESEIQTAKDNRSKSKYSTIERSTSTTTAPEIQNEVLPASSRGRQRGRTLAPAPVEEEILDDRVTSSTRFPPRGRYLTVSSSTTYVPEVSSESARHRGQQRTDSVADESIGHTKSRTRAHIRRPSSELVDLDSFKTHSGDIPAPHKEQPSRYSSESKTTTDLPEVAATVKDLTKESPREPHSISSGIRFQEISADDIKVPAGYKYTTTEQQDTTEYTTMTAMEKVALDLYAYLAGENLNNEVNPEIVTLDGTTTETDETFTTEALTTTEEVTTTTTSSTTTTTTTPAPTTTTTTVAPTRPSRFKGRNSARGRSSSTTSAPTEAPLETSTRIRGRFNKPGIHAVRKTAGAPTSTSTSPAEGSSTPASEKPATAKAFGRRGGLFAGRTRPSTTTAAPAADAAGAATSEAVAPPSAPRARLRPGLRRTTTTTTTAEPTAEESSSPSSANVDAAETTPAPSRVIGGRGRPLGGRPSLLRPGARLNLKANPRLRPGGSSVAPADVTSETPAPAETSISDSPATDPDTEESSASSPAPEQPRNGLRSRNRLQVSPSPKPRAPVTQPPRRPNPLLRRKTPAETTTEQAKKSTEPLEESTNADKSSSEKNETEETESQPAETTPAPPLRGLDALFARRRASGGIGTRPARPARGVNPK